MQSSPITLRGRSMTHNRGRIVVAILGLLTTSCAHYSNQQLVGIRSAVEEADQETLSELLDGDFDRDNDLSFDIIGLAVTRRHNGSVDWRSPEIIDSLLRHNGHPVFSARYAGGYRPRGLALEVAI